MERHRARRSVDRGVGAGNRRRQAIRRRAIAVSAGLAFGGLAFASTAAAAPPSPPFHQCPAIGADASCGILLYIDTTGAVSAASDPSQGPYDGFDDTLVGVLNASGRTIPSLHLSGPNVPFGFDLDGICSGSFSGTPAGCPFGTSGYEGPGTSYANVSGDFLSGDVVFAGGLAPGATAYFSLEGAISANSLHFPDPTAIVNTGAVTSDYHDPAVVSAKLTDVTTGAPEPGQLVTFTLNSSESCTATTNAAGAASCSITPGEPAGSYPLVISSAGDSNFQPGSQTVAFTVTKEETTLTYTGDTHVANATTATLSGVLKEDGVAPIGGRTVTFSLGGQTCSGTTNAAGQASCTVTTNQPAGTTSVPITATFAGDGFYLPASATSTARLTYMTGRSYGLAATAKPLGLGLITIVPTPDTGSIATSAAGSTNTPCVATVTGPISASALCVGVVTAVAPGKSTAAATVATLGITGLAIVPTVGATAIAAGSTTTCSGASGATTFASLTIAGVHYVNYAPAPNTTIALPLGLGKIVLNEQLPVAGADHGVTVNAIHITVPSLGTNIVVASATSDIHNCG